MGELYFNPQNPLVDGNKASRPFVRFLNALVKSLGTGSGPILPGPITAAGLTMNSSRLLGRTSGGIGDPQEISVDGTLTLAAGVLGVAAGAAIVQRATVTLTNAQITALPTTRVQVVAACASGFRNKFLSVSCSLNASAGAYTNLNTTYASLQIETSDSRWVSLNVSNDTATTPVLSRLSDFLAAASTRVMDIGPYVDGFTNAGVYPDYVQPVADIQRSSVEASALYLSLDNNGSGDLTGGNAANSLKCTVLYTVEAL